MAQPLSSPRSAISVLVADDHQLLRDMMGELLHQEGDMSIDTASDLPSTLEKIRENGAYDVVLLDYLMPGVHGLDGVRQAIEANAPNPVVLISGNITRDKVNEAMAIGVRGYIPKTLAAKSLAHAIRFVAAGETFVPLSFLNGASDTSAEESFGLSQQERRVLSLLAEGKSNKEIARDISRSEVTVKMHMRAICQKLEAKNRTHAVLIAKDSGIV